MNHTFDLINKDEFGTPRAAYNQYPSISQTGDYVTFISTTLAGESFYTGDSNQHVLLKDRTSGNIEVIDKNSMGIVANRGSYGNAGISDNGRFVVFQSSATNLDPGKTSSTQDDIFLRDRLNNTTVLVSRTPGGLQGNDYSENPRISGDGTKVIFSSSASNLVANDTNSSMDLFSYDVASGTVTRVSVDENGVQGTDGYSVNGKISTDGSKIALATTHTLSTLDQNFGDADVYLYDTNTPGTVELSTVSYNTAPGSRSLFPTLSPDGNLVLFETRANNLIPLDLQNYTNIFLHNRTTNTTSHISKALGGVTPDRNSGFARMSADGKFIVFQSNANNLDATDTNTNSDIFLYDVDADTISLISKSTGGTISDSYSRQPSISADGRYITYVSEATNLVANDTNGEADIFLYDRVTQSTTRVNVDSSNNEASKAAWSPDPAASRPQITADGTKVIFSSFQNNLVAGDTNNAEDVFIRDLTNNTTTRISKDTNGSQLTKGAMYPSISDDASIITFQEPLKNGNRVLYYRASDDTVHEIAPTTGHTSHTPYFQYPVVSGNGQYITFHSLADNLVAGDTNHRWDTFQYHISTNTLSRISTSSGGTEANKTEWIPYYSPASLSRNGKTVAYVSTASNLVAGDTNGMEDIFITSMENAKVGFDSTSITAAEIDGTSNLVLNVSEGILLTDRTVTVTVTGGTAVNGTDYTFTSPATITIPAGDYTIPQQISVPVTLIADSLLEGTETIIFHLTVSDPALEAGTILSTQIDLQNSVSNSAPLAPTGLFANTQSATAQTGSMNPTNLSNPNIVLSALFQDADTGDTGTKYAVQVATDTGFTSLVYSSTGVGTALVSPVSIGARSEDIPLLGFTPVSGTTYSFRIKFWDNSNTEGAFSTGGTFIYNAPAAPSSGFTGGGGGYTPSNTNSVLHNQNSNLSVNNNTNTPAVNDNRNSSTTISPQRPDHQTNTNSPVHSSAPETLSPSTPVGRFNIPFKDTICAPMKPQNLSAAQNISEEDLRVFVENLLKKGVAFQKNGETFDPTSTVNRSEMLRYILQANCEDFRYFSEFPAPFPDVEITHEDALFIYLAKLRSIVRGYLHDGTFKPDNSITRAEALKVVLEMTLSDGTFKFSGEAKPFTDVNWNDESIWYKNYLSYAVEKGIITTPASKNFRPNDKALKSEIIYMLARSLSVKNN